MVRASLWSPFDITALAQERDDHVGIDANQQVAFMLYRQHFQAAVVARHPGLANPEISKIIGRQWREEDQDVKDTWDALAEVRQRLSMSSESPTQADRLLEGKSPTSSTIPQLQIPASTEG
jgi:RuvB-like protein 1 (pontin 52)/HMG box factor